jgi:hypothetical protein
LYEEWRLTFHRLEEISLAKDEIMTRLTAMVLICFSLCLGCATSIFAAAKKTPPAAKSQSAPNPNDKPSDPPANLPGKLQDAANGAGSKGNDYVTCFFDRDDLLRLRPKPEASTLSSYDAEQLRNNVIHEALDPANASTFEDDQAKQFATEIGSTVFEGLTPSQALSKTLSILAMHTQKTVLTEGDASKVRSTVSASVSSRPTSSFKSGNPQTFAEKIAGIPIAGRTGSSVESDLNGAVQSDIADPNAQSEASAAIKQAVTEATKASPSPAKDKVAGAAQATLATVQRPPDIFCSTTILSYETMRKAFGETMADEYLGVQVVVRNLNANQEFLVQSALFKVDSDINGRIGKYFTGVDKMTAREYMLASRDLGKRNLAVHVAQAAGSILSSVATFTGPGVKLASGGVNGGLISALTTVLPDHNTEQLKLIDDEGFSNSRTDRTVVPKSGTAEFVIFVSSKEFEEGWWTQDCAQNEVIRVTKSSQGPAPSDTQIASCIGNLNRATPDPKCVSAEISIDLGAAREVCEDALSKAGELVKGTDSTDSTLEYYKPKGVDYQHWSGRSLSLFRELSLAVVAGTHVNESTDTTPSLTKIDCPVDDKGDLKLDSAKTLTCSLTGTNLDKVAQLKLRNAQDKTDIGTATGGVTTTTSGDSKSTSVGFQTADLQKLTASAYSVSTVTPAGVETETDQILHLSNGPSLTEVSPSPINQADLLKKTVTLTGYMLDKLKNICLATGAATAGLTVSVADSNETPATKRTLDFSKVQKPMANGTYTIYLDACENAPQTPSSQKLVVIAPVISDFSPASGKVGDAITINGTNLKDATSLSFGGKAAKLINSSNEQLKATLPAGAQTGKLTVTTPAGAATSETEFKVISTKTASH